MRNDLAGSEVRQAHKQITMLIVLTLEFKEVVAARRSADLSERSMGIEISVRYSTAFADAFKKASAIMVG